MCLYFYLETVAAPPLSLAPEEEEEGEGAEQEEEEAGKENAAGFSLQTLSANKNKSRAENTCAAERL